MSLVLSSALLTGCATTTDDCAWSRDIFFGSADTVEWLAENDQRLLRDIVTHNETRQEVCS